MPPDASAELIVFTGNNEKMPEVAARARGELLEDLTQELRKHDYLVEPIAVDAPPEPAIAVEAPPDPAPAAAPTAESASFAPSPPVQEAPPAEAAPDPAPDPAPEQESAADELRFAATQAQNAADQALDEMFRTIQMKKSDALSYRRSLGPEVNQFAERVDAQALLFVRYRYATKSGGEIAKDVAFSILLGAATLGNAVVIQHATAARLDVCLVDGATGDVLYANSATLAQVWGDPATEALAQMTMEGFSPR